MWWHHPLSGDLYLSKKFSWVSQGGKLVDGIPPWFLLQAPAMDFSPLFSVIDCYWKAWIRQTLSPLNCSWSQCFLTVTESFKILTWQGNLIKRIFQVKIKNNQYLLVILILIGETKKNLWGFAFILCLPKSVPSFLICSVSWDSLWCQHQNIRAWLSQMMQSSFLEGKHIFKNNFWLSPFM